ncbi:MAG: hypothetical protein ACLFQW_04155 [Spirochaetaceae bacterium]
MHVKTLAKTMAIYNTVIAGGFGLFLLLLVVYPRLAEKLLWGTADAGAVALLFPLFAVLAGYTWVYRNQLERLRPVFVIQLAYKPFAIILLVAFAAAGLMHWFWSILISLALVVYIVGHGVVLKKIHETASSADWN